MDGQGYRFCKKCLTRDMIDKDAYFKNLQELIKAIDEEVKTPDDAYEERLSICKECDYLYDGMCRACGCYVELRAANRNNECSYKKWSRI